jgi:hypothetical protein
MAALSPNGKRRIRVTEGEISPLSPCGIRKNIMEIDFDARDAISDFISVPAGTYVCRITEVRTGTTRAGDERWSIRLVVDEGMHVGKQAAWDSLVFSVRGRTRARLLLYAFGLPSKGKVQLQPEDLDGRRAMVEVRPTEYEASSGQIVRRNEVPYDGYRIAEERVPADRIGTDSDEGSQVLADDPATNTRDVPF